MLTSRTLFLAAFVGSMEAFCPNSFSSPRQGSVATFLTTEDGNELIAASQKVYRPVPDAQDEDDDYLDDPFDTNSVVEEEEEGELSLITAPRGAAVAFVKRLFAQPTAAFHPNEAEGLDGYSADEEGDDVVYFPIVGFTFVKDGPNHCRALPSVSNPSCRVRGDVCDHVHVGSWSQAK